jgi:hypothetical protein
VRRVFATALEDPVILPPTDRCHVAGAAVFWDSDVESGGVAGADGVVAGVAASVDLLRIAHVEDGVGGEELAEVGVVVAGGSGGSWVPPTNPLSILDGQAPLLVRIAPNGFAVGGRRVGWRWRRWWEAAVPCESAMSRVTPVLVRVAMVCLLKL